MQFPFLPDCESQHSFYVLTCIWLLLCGRTVRAHIRFRRGHRSRGGGRESGERRRGGVRVCVCAWGRIRIRVNVIEFSHQRFLRCWWSECTGKRERERKREGEADTCKWFSGGGSQHETNTKRTSRGKIGWVRGSKSQTLLSCVPTHAR